MWNSEWNELFLPREEEEDAVFRAYVNRLSVLGLRVIAAVCMGGAAYVALIALFGFGGLLLVPGGVTVTTVIALLGAGALGASYVEELHPFARGAGIGVGYGVALSQFFGLSALVQSPELSFFLVSGIVTGVLLIGTAALPVKPVHIFGLGSLIAVSFLVLTPVVAPALAAQRTSVLLHVLQVVLLCTALTVVVYRQRVLAHRARRSAQLALDELRTAQARLVVSESAHAQSRFAAALSHEINTPLGALASACDTLAHVCRKEGLFDDPRYRDVLSGAEQAGRGSAARLNEIVARIAYLTNLDRADEQPTDLSELCRQTAASLRSELENRVAVELDLEPVRTVSVKPQQVSAVLSNLLRNAAQATKPRGGVVLRTYENGAQVIVEVRDEGRGIEPDRLKHLFEPSLRVDGGRVAAVNWSLFVCRTIAHEHGGELHLISTPGKGTTARLSLPTGDRAEKTRPGVR